MKKQVISATMAAMVVLTAAMTPTTTIAGEVSNGIKIVQNQSNVITDVQTDLTDSANYMMSYLEKTIFAADYQISYTDYQDAMFALKAGADNEKVIEKLNTVLKEKLAAYDDSFLNPYASTGVQSFALATVIVYLEEQGVDVTAYEGINLIEKFEATFLAETEPNPYVYQYISAIEKHTGKLSDQVMKKVKEDVLKYYVNNETGIGIDYWGVSADNNGQVLTALLNEYATDADVKAKVDAALEWNAAQKDASGAIVSWGAPNASATAMAMRAAAQFGKMDDAAGYYKAMEQFVSTANKGAYTYNGEDSIYSSRDALTGLLAYKNALEGKDLFAVTEKQEPEQPSNEPEESAKPQTTTKPEESKEPQTSKEPQATELYCFPVSQEGVKDTDKATGNPTAQPTNSIAPATGDNSKVGLWAAVMAVSGAVVLTKGGKKKRYEQD